MAADMIKAILLTEAQGRENEKKAALAGEKIIEEAKKQANEIIKSAVEQAQKQASIILSDAEYSSAGVLKQANKLASMREKKSITDTEKQYEKAIKMVFEEILR